MNWAKSDSTGRWGAAKNFFFWCFFRHLFDESLTIGTCSVNHKEMGGR
jgi:hypothetical protein